MRCGCRSLGLLALPGLLFATNAAAGPAGADRAAPPADQVPIQAPADPGAVGAMMSEMKKAADAIIASAKAACAEEQKKRTALFVRAEGRIHQVMLPRFGPANAWLYNERARKIAELNDALGLPKDRFLPFADYARETIAAILGGEDLSLFTDAEAGLSLSTRTAAPDGGEQRSWVGPLRGDQIMAAEELARVLGWFRARAKAGLVPGVNRKKHRVRLADPKSGRRVELVFQNCADRWVVVEMILNR